MKTFVIKHLVVFSCLLQCLSAVAYAQNESRGIPPLVDRLQFADEDYQYDEYFVIEPAVSSNERSIHLNQFKNLKQKFPLPLVKYNRQKHFGSWIRPIKGHCENTRALVLMRDSQGNVNVNSNCSVTAGDWRDPYTNMNFSQASDIQIDHVVPLKNAYMTGAYKWDYLKRCLYANFLGNKFHLLSVSGMENERKGDRSPREYVPPNKDFTCQYVKEWLEIKYVWKLLITPPEKIKIDQLIAENNCDDTLFKINKSSIDLQNQYIEEHKNLCQ